MKNRLFKIMAPVFAICCLASCESWTEPEAKNIDVPGKSLEYYQQLRAYKNSDHQVTFGWFGNWTGKGSSLSNSMAGLPDSVDFVSMWGNWRNPTEAQLKDLRFVQKVKGTKALMCFIVANIGDQLTPKEQSGDIEQVKQFWGWKDDNKDMIKTAIEKYANAICDTIDKYQYDGFDIDYEPHYGAAGNLASYPDNMTTFVEALAKRIGPKSGTGRLLVIDGEPQSIAPATGPCFDWFIVQAYACTSSSNLDKRLAATIDNFKGILEPIDVARKYIVTENFENYAQLGGVNFRDKDGKRMKSLEGMARWNPTVNGVSVRKGGVGTYHMEYEFNVPGKNGTYPFLRQATYLINNLVIPNSPAK